MRMTWMLFPAAVIVVALQFSSPAQTEDPPASKATDQKPPPKPITRQGVTIALTLTDDQSREIAQALDQTPRKSVRLAVRGLVAPSKWDYKSTIRVFVNNDKATGETEPDAPHFAHAILLSARDGGKPQNVALDLAGPLERLRKAGKWKPFDPIQITLVVAPSSPDAMPPGVEVEFKGVQISVPTDR